MLDFGLTCLKDQESISQSKSSKQAGTELVQAQLMFGFDFTSLFCIIGFPRSDLVELVWWISFCRFD